MSRKQQKREQVQEQVQQQISKQVAGQALQIEYLDPATLRDYERNSRTHSEEQVKQIAESIRVFGFKIPILIDENNIIIAGHGRRAAAMLLKLPLVPCVRDTELTEEKKKAFRIADNQIAMNSGWDENLLRIELNDLHMDGFNLDIIGFDDDSLDSLFGDTQTLILEESPTPEEDEIPEVQPVVISQKGDVWILGNHRLVCGDSTKAKDVQRLMEGKRADAVLTDPPYGQGQAGVPGDEPDNLKNIVEAAAILPADNAAIVAFQSPRTFHHWLNRGIKAGLSFERMLWLSKKAQIAYPWRGWILKSEAILVHSKGKPQWNDVKPYVHDTYELPYVSKELPEGTGWHGSVKPQVVLQDIVTRICKPGQLVYDPFCGSGSTLIACEATGRVCYCMELEPAYCDVIIRRFQQVTGQQGIHRASGWTFNDMIAAKEAEASAEE